MNPNIIPAGTLANASANFPQRFPGNSAWGIQVNWAGLDAVNGSVQIQQSNDNLNWNSLGVAYTLGAAGGTKSFEDVKFTHSFIRIKYLKGGNTTGTIEAILNIKRIN